MSTRDRIVAVLNHNATVVVFMVLLAALMIIANVAIDGWRAERWAAAAARHGQQNATPPGGR